MGETNDPKPNFIVDGMDEHGDWIADGGPPYRVFDIKRQTHMASSFDTRESAEREAKRLNDNLSFKKRWAMEIMVRLLEVKRFEKDVLQLSLGSLEQTLSPEELLIGMAKLREQCMQLSKQFDVKLGAWADVKRIHALLYERAKGHPGTQGDIKRWTDSAFAKHRTRGHADS